MVDLVVDWLPVDGSSQVGAIPKRIMMAHGCCLGGTTTTTDRSIITCLFVHPAYPPLLFVDTGES